MNPSGDGVVRFLDDILITGKDKEKHLARLKVVLLRLQNAGLKLALKKCEFLNVKLTYLGFDIDKGLHTSDTKILAFLNAPRPTDVT